jgi:PadR family transcriptional regulator, regulatory protein PadR
MPPRRSPSEKPAHGSTSGGPRPTVPPRGGMGGMRDMLVPYVLLAVSVQRAHGYLIEEYLRGLGFFSLEMSTLYRTLRQLEKDGLLASGWEPGPSGPARRVYTLTDAGRAWLDAWAGALEGYRALIDRFFGLYAGSDTRAHPRTGDTHA